MDKPVLPTEKQNKLANKVAADVKKVLVDNYRELRKHEVDKNTARSIVVKGGQGGTKEAENELVKSAE